MTKLITTHRPTPLRNLWSNSRHYTMQLGRLLINKNTIVEVICALHIILFVYTGLNKIMDVDKFRFEIGRSPFIQNMSGFIAATLPLYELLLALGLIFKRTRLWALYLTFALMLLFTGYIWLMLNYAYDLPCSCGGIVSELSWHEHLIFNSSFSLLSIIAIALWVKIIPYKKDSLQFPKL